MAFLLNRIAVAVTVSAVGVIYTRDIFLFCVELILSVYRSYFSALHVDLIIRRDCAPIVELLDVVRSFEMLLALLFHRTISNIISLCLELIFPSTRCYGAFIALPGLARICCI